MSEKQEAREVVPAGKRNPSWHHMVPIAKFLIERGHPPINYAERSGFAPTQQGMKCRLGYWITDEEWAEINEVFVIPANIKYFDGMIRDSVNRVDIIGHEQVQCEDGVHHISVWEERERKAGRL